ncbi:MAG TPA: CPBP family intramembrane glutamic endopeptidase [Mucilaginibacter sp.]|nr:CPBP family intramembrane glutamic endopeptidase [Mucilaginibacter sp.]
MNTRSLIRKYPVASYFMICFTISWLGAFALVAHKIFSGQDITKMDSLLMFPVMILGPAITGITLTAIVNGENSLKNLRMRMGKWKVPVKWYFAAIIIPPVLITTVLLLLSHFVSPVFRPNFFPLGFLFGIPAGFMEEIGWTGFAFPEMQLKYGTMKGGIVLGLLWSLWHLPVIDSLGAASPHGKYLPLFFLSFAGILTAMRLIIAWIYSNTESIPLAQLTHIVSTGSLVMFGAPPSPGLTPLRETLWYGAYAVLLWVVVFIIYRTQPLVKNRPVPNAQPL